MKGGWLVKRAGDGREFETRAGQAARSHRSSFVPRCTHRKREVGDQAGELVLPQEDEGQPQCGGAEPEGDEGGGDDNLPRCVCVFVCVREREKECVD